MAEQVWIVPQFVNQPKQAGGKFGSVKCAELGYISVPVAALGQFQKGKRVFIEYEMKGEYKNFVRFPNPAPHTPAPQQYQAPQRQAAPAQRQAHTASVADPTAMNIFVTGIVGRALGSGHFNASDIAQLTAEAKKAFLLHLNGNEGPRHSHPDMDDPLPSPDDYGIGAALNHDPRDDTVPF